MQAHAVAEKKGSDETMAARICMFCEKPLYARGVCRSHYQKAASLGIPPLKLATLAGVLQPEKKEKTVSPRMTEAAYSRLERAVARGRAVSVYALACDILESWRDQE